MGKSSLLVCDKNLRKRYNPPLARYMADYEGASATVYGEHEKVDILRQLDRLLDNPHFSHSKRFPGFLRFVSRRNSKVAATSLRNAH